MYTYSQKWQQRADTVGLYLSKGLDILSLYSQGPKIFSNARKGSSYGGL